MSWLKVPLLDFCIRITKGTTPTTFGKSFTEDGINFIKAEALNGDPCLSEQGFSHIDEQTYDLLARSKLLEDDVLITIAGAKIGQAGIVQAKHVPANTNQAVGIVRVSKDKAYPRYVYYFFKQQSTFNYIQNLNGQAAQPNLNLQLLGEIQVPLPHLSLQIHIADKIAAYDSLIENNLRRIELLENVARLIYKEWFVKLNFPGREHTKIVDGVPEGWDRKTLSEITSFLSRGISPNYDDEAEFTVINQKCIRNNRLDLTESRKQSKAFSEEKQIQFGDVLINSTGTGTLGRTAMVFDIFEKCTVDSHVTIARPLHGIGFCWFGYMLSFMEPILENMAEGATNQKELGRTRLRELQILVPSQTLRKSYEDYVHPIKRQILILQSQNKKLRQARDLLLPKLMSGEIAV